MACFGLPEGGSQRVAVLSPHLDDAVLSLGASICEAARHGHDVTIITVFAGDPDSTDPPGRWDRRTGFTTAGEAVRRRREEDRRACALVGAEPLWLPFVDGDYGGERSREAVWASLAEELPHFDAVLLPGRPLIHPDHLWLARCIHEHGAEPARLGLYAELPYDFWPANDSKPAPALPRSSAVWATPRVRLNSRRTKWQACAAYSSQLPWLGRGRFRTALLRTRIGGERIAWAEV
jgi:LmbE family N-acetylglucosaminyl deacetylase